MGVRMRLKIGDIFMVPLDDGKVGYVQYIADDSEMLDSYVIRAFVGKYDDAEVRAVSDIVTDEVSFHAHVFLKLCVKFGLWKKVGNAPAPQRIDVLFRGCWDDGEPSLNFSNLWYVWRINEPFRDIGKLAEKYMSAEIGSVMPPQAIAQRMTVGYYTLGPPYDDGPQR